jgi:phage repressor protein C with HTH and peptisase S24 domain
MKSPRSLLKLKKSNIYKSPTRVSSSRWTEGTLMLRAALPISRSSWPMLMRTVQGHSMMPVLPPNTLVIAWKNFRKLRPDDVVIFQHEGKEKIKRIQDVRGSEIFVVGDHPDASTDSRHYGWIYESDVVAKVIYPRDLRPINT